MTFDDPISFREAVRQWLARQVMPTNLTSAELSQISKEIMRKAVTSAQTTITGLLDRYKDGIASILNPQQVLRPGETLTVTEGYNPATLKTFIQDYLRSISYTPPQGKEGTIEDLSSDARVKLVVKTNTELVQGAGRFIRANSDADTVDLYPAWELVRYEQKKEPRDWHQRWRIAAQTAGDAKAAACLELHGKMCALKNSGIWQALGDGAGGYDDTLGNPFPPLAFGTGMWVDDVSRREAEAIGLLEPGEKAEPATFDLSTLLEP